MSDADRVAEKLARQERVSKAFVGKTIKSIDRDCCNLWIFRFTDDTEQKVWAELAVHTAFGGIPGLFLPEEL